MSMFPANIRLPFRRIQNVFSDHISSYCCFALYEWKYFDFGCSMEIRVRT